MVKGMTRTFVAGVGGVAAHTRVKLSGTTVVTAGDEESAIGVADYDASEGENVAVRLINAGGTIECVAAGAITGGAAVYAAADGEVEAAGTSAKGFALDTATAEGDVIECYFTD